MTQETLSFDVCPICGDVVSLSVATGSPVEYEQQRDALIQAAKLGDQSAWGMGKAWHILTHKHLWRGHYDSPEAFLKAELEDRHINAPARSTLQQMAKVASAFDKTDAVPWFTLFLALHLWQQLGYRTFSRTHPENEIIKVPQEGGPAVEKPLGGCTRDDLHAALEALKKPQDSELSAKDLAIEKLLQAGLDKLVASDGHGSVHLVRQYANARLRVRLSLDMSVDKLKDLFAIFKQLV